MKNNLCNIKYNLVYVEIIGMCICKIIKNKDIMLEYNIGIVYSMCDQYV